MLLLPELIARKWEDAKSEFENAVRSGSRPGSGADVEAILNEIAGMIRSVGREELEAAARVSSATPRPGKRVVLAAPQVTTDIPAIHLPENEDFSVDSPGRTTDLPAATGIYEGKTDRDTGHAFPIKVQAVSPDGKTPTIDQTGEHTPEVDESAETDASPRPGAKTERKIPRLPGYEITGILGRGGMGVVYKATQVGLRRTVALKMILSGEHASGTQLGRFEAEARAVALIRHPGIVQIYEIGEHEGLPYFTLEYCPGGSLDRKLKHDPQPPREAAALIEKLALAMFAAHTAGVVHRDLKPGNVLLDADGTPKITDFGLARELDDEEGQTRTGSILGTPSYMAPEQAAGQNKQVGPAADQYSLGATLYELITGRPPFQGTNVMEIVSQVRTREPVAPSQLQPACPKDLETICLKTLQKEPEKRYATCESFAADLRAYLEGRPIAARPVGRPEKVWRWAKRNPRIAGLAAAVALLLLVLSIGGSAAAVIFANQKQEAVELAEGRRIAQEQAEIKRIEAEKARDEKDVALQSEKKALKAEAAEFEFTRDTVFVALDEIPTALTQAVFARGAEQQVLESLGVMLEKQLNREFTRGLPDRALLTFHMQMGELHSRRSKPKEAEQSYRSSLIYVDRQIATEEKEKDKAKGNRALLLRKLGSLCRDFYRDRGGDALKLYAEAAKVQREIVDAPTTGELPPAETKASLAGTLSDIAETYRRMSMFDKAKPHAEESLKLWREVVALPSTRHTKQAPQFLAEAQVQLGKILVKVGEEAAGEKELAAGVEQYRKLQTATPANIALRVAAAKAFREHGDYLLMRGKLDAATPLHEWDLDLIRGLLRTPELLAAQSELASVYYRSATLALKKGDRPKAEKYYRQCLELRMAVAETQPTNAVHQIRVANAQARCGMHVEASKTMEALVVKFKSDPFVIRQAALTIAICPDAVQAGRAEDKLTPAEIKLRDQYTDRALTLLEDAVNRLGFSDLEQLKTDPDLDAIRTAPRFTALVRKLEKTPAKKP